MSDYDAVVVGAGPNGLAAAAELTRHGRQVLVIEQAEVIGGGTRTEELTRPGFLHDVCSAIHPLGVASPFFRSVGLDVTWIDPPIPVSHPLEGGRPGGILRDIETTAALFEDDGRRWANLIGPLARSADDVVDDFLGPMPLAPRHPAAFARMAANGALTASALARRFDTDTARAVVAGLAAHAIAPFAAPFTGGVVLLFALTAHAYGWPLVAGGSQRVADALARVVEEGGGRVETGRLVASLDDLPPAPIVILDTSPRSALSIAGDRVDPRRRRRLLARRSGPAVFKLDYALDGPIPWLDELSGQAGTVHLGGTWEEVAEAEDLVQAGHHAERPFVLVAQQSLFDPLRAPTGKQTAWAYCHVPNGSDLDMSGAIEDQIERFAPGFRDLVIERHTMGPAALEAHDPNYLGGDIAGGAFGARKLLQFGLADPYRLGDGLFICSSATPPGAGVHGMCGYHAARAALGSDTA